MFIIFLVSGFWHGANWTFVAWGLTHAICYSAYHLIWGNGKEATGSSTWSTVFSGAITFIVVVIAWVFFRAENVTQAFSYLSGIATHTFASSDVWGFLPLLALLIPFHLLEYVNRGSENGVLLENVEIPKFWKRALELALALLIIDCFYTLNHEQFIYFQF